MKAVKEASTPKNLYHLSFLLFVAHQFVHKDLAIYIVFLIEQAKAKQIEVETDIIEFNQVIHELSKSRLCRNAIEHINLSDKSAPETLLSIRISNQIDTISSIWNVLSAINNDEKWKMRGKQHIVKLLLQYPTINPNVENNLLIKTFFKTKQWDMVRLLLNHPRLNQDAPEVCSIKQNLKHIPFNFFVSKKACDKELLLDDQNARYIRR